MSQIAINSDADLMGIANSAGSDAIEYTDGYLICDASQEALDAALAAYDHSAYISGAKLKAMTREVQAHMDAAAELMGYDNIFTAISYASSSHATFGPEAILFRDWRDAVWDVYFSLLGAWQAGGDEPTLESVIAALPVSPGQS
jgi:hypothetical protein